MPNSKPKRLIEFGWDEPDTAFMRRHLAQMEQTPFDGCVFHITYTRPDGSPGRFMNECWGRRAFTQAELQQSLQDLQETPFDRFSHNFLRFNVCPGNVDWFEDFTAITNNARQAASIARQGKATGILFDIEQYNSPLFDFRQQRDAELKGWNDYARQARQRGREVMQAFQTGFADLTVLLTFGYCLPHKQCGGDPAKLPQIEYGLLAPFLDGLLDAAEGKARLVDGYELSYGYREPEQFDRAYQTMRTGVLPLVADPDKYQRVMSFAFGIWMDYDWRKPGWDEVNLHKNYFTPHAFEQSVRRALEVSDEYVWIYTETPRWWSKLGAVKLPQPYIEALRKASSTPSSLLPP